MLLPLAIGLFVNRRFPQVAARLRLTVSMVGKVGLAIGLLAVLALHGRALLGTFGTGALAALIALGSGPINRIERNRSAVGDGCRGWRS